jgi:hypothetical protein
MSDQSKRKSYELLRKVHSYDGEFTYHLAVFGDFIAKREGYKEHKELDAVYFYLVQKYSWPLSQVRGMSIEDIRFLLEEEMNGWSLPEEARFSDAPSKPKRARR